LIVSKEYSKFITTGFTEEEVEANARLINCAPELLEQLKIAIECIVSEGENYCAKQVAAMRLVIDKAEWKT
jgi:hypothetical protein